MLPRRPTALGVVRALAMLALPVCIPNCGEMGEAMSTMSNAETVAQRFTEDVAAHRYQKAYARLCAPYRSAVPFKRFEHAIAKNAYLQGASSVTFPQTSTTLGSVTLNGYLKSSAGNVALECHFTSSPPPLCITGMIIGGSPALPSAAD